MASGGADTNVLVWDVSSLGKGAKGADAEWTRKDLERMWDTLADEDAGKAAPVMGALAQAPGRSEAFLREALGKLAAGDGPKIRQLIADLDSDQFEMRRRATRELEKLGESVEVPLHTVLANRPSLELHHRVTALLERMESPPTPAYFQNLRAVEVLEQIGTKEALALLAEIAARPELTRLTRQARQAQGRLATVGDATSRRQGAIADPHEKWDSGAGLVARRQGHRLPGRRTRSSAQGQTAGQAHPTGEAQCSSGR